MRQDSLPSLLPTLIPLALGAGQAIMRVYAADDCQLTLKADESPLTAADTAAHQHLVAGLAGLLPGCPVVSEEDAESFVHRRSQGRFWLIDPLDGTKEFLARNGEFTVNIALIEDGRATLGLVHAPALGLTYWGGRGQGAYRMNGTAGEAQAIRVSSEPMAGTACRVVASKSHMNAETQAFIDRLGAVTLVQAGSSLKLCRVAEGAADIYPRLAPTCEWDTAAAHAVLEGAGGRVVDLQGHDLPYGKPDVLNPSFIATRSLALLRR